MIESQHTFPIWDRHCVECHNPQKREGGVLMTGDRGPVFSHSYYMLTARRQVSDGRNLPVSSYAPRTLGDSASLLMHKLEGKHHDVVLPPHDHRMVQYWIHTGGVWIGTYAALGTGMIGGYAQNQIDRQDLTWPSVNAAARVLQERCARCHRGDTALPQSPSDNMGMMPWTIQYGHPKLRFSRHILYNLTTPQESLLLLAPRGKAGVPCATLFETTEDPDYKILLTSVQDTKSRLDEIKRFDMPGFKTRPAYVREMKRYGVLTQTFDLAKDPIDVYETDRCYWESLWYRPSHGGN